MISLIGFLNHAACIFYNKEGRCYGRANLGEEAQLLLEHV